MNHPHPHQHPHPPLGPRPRPSRAAPRRLPRPAAAVLALCLAACGGGSSEPPVIPLFEFIFRDADLAWQDSVYEVSLSLSPPNPTEPRGNFTGANLAASDGFAVFLDYQPTGTYDGCQSTLEVGDTAQPPIAPRYSGRFTGNDTLVLTPVGHPELPVLQLQRDPKGTRDMGCG